MPLRSRTLCVLPLVVGKSFSVSFNMEMSLALSDAPISATSQDQLLFLEHLTHSYIAALTTGHGDTFCISLSQNSSKGERI